MQYRFVVTLSVLASSCSTSQPVPIDAQVIDAPEPLAALLAPQAVETEQFASSVYCSQCHLRGDSAGTAMTTTAGDDVSPVALWRSSMMALAARDPFYLAVFEKEIVEAPGQEEAIEAVCSRCHAPAGSVAAEGGGARLSFHELTAGTSVNASIGRDGVTCSFCHQIKDIDLGRDASFTGGFLVGFAREIYGPHSNPITSAMQMFVRYTPVVSEHIKGSALCATCHTVIVEGVSGQEVVEQAPYLEWLNSSYNDEGAGQSGASCQTCHMPRRDNDDGLIATAIAKYPEEINDRQRYSQHTFVGGNSFMLRLMAANEEWVNSGVPAASLEATAVLSDDHLAQAASLELVGSRSGEDVQVDVRVRNLAGHKLPTGYPTRRAWLHLVARDPSGTVVFESGGYDSEGRIQGLAEGVEPHHTEISSTSQVQIYQQSPVDSEGVVTLRALNVSSVAKDNRILPLGWSSSHPQINRIKAIGVDGDDDFIGGSDSVTYRFQHTGASQLSVSAELLYQSVPPQAIDATAGFRVAASERFVSMARKADNTPITMALADTTIAP